MYLAFMSQDHVEEIVPLMSLEVRRTLEKEMVKRRTLRLCFWHVVVGMTQLQSRWKGARALTKSLVWGVTQVSRKPLYSPGVV